MTVPIQGPGVKTPEEIWLGHLTGDLGGHGKDRYKEAWAFISYRSETVGWMDIPIPVYEKGNDLLRGPGSYCQFDRGRILQETDRLFEKHGVGDLYFSMNIFSRPERRQEYALPSQWLYADLDEAIVPFSTPCNPQARRQFWMTSPTLLWETSPGRQQAAWFLNRPLSPGTHRKLNQRLTYMLGADKGGWGLTKVLRIPDTRNFKYGEFQAEDGGHVGLQSYQQGVWGQSLWREFEFLAPRDYEVKVSWVIETLKHIRGIPGDAPVPVLKLRRGDARGLMKKHKKRLLKAGVHGQLRAAKVPEHRDRSKALWGMEKAMLKAGIPPEDVFVLVRDSVWNKFRGRQREVDQLWAEINKALAEVDRKQAVA